MYAARLTLLLLLLLLAAAPSALLNAQPGRFGLPACDGPHRELAVRPGFLLCHDSTLRVPVWTAYELTRHQLAAATPTPAASKRLHFRRDAALSGAAASAADYRNSGFVRGHLVPAADQAWSDESLEATFLLSNAVPQDPSLNAGRWRALENAIRRLALNADSVIVFTGPIFCPDEDRRIGPHLVAVPCALFKVALAVTDSRVTRLDSVIIANQPDHSRAALAGFAASPAEIAGRTGLPFFATLPAR